MPFIDRMTSRTRSGEDDSRGTSVTTQRPVPSCSCMPYARFGEPPARGECAATTGRKKEMCWSMKSSGEYFTYSTFISSIRGEKGARFPRESKQLKLTTPSDPVGRAIEICRSAHCLGDDDDAILLFVCRLC
jgi:hypothetical protein